MTTRTIRTRDGDVTILTGPPRPSSPLPRSRETAPMLPPPSIGNQRTEDGWPACLLMPDPLHLIQRYHNADLQLPPGWPPALEWRPPYGHVLKSQLPPPNPSFDPRSMLWWSQWEIVFAKRALGLSDADTCSLFKYRWREMDKSTEDMQPYHVAQIIDILSDGHPWHAHAFCPGDSRPEIEICVEFLQDLRMAREDERMKRESDRMAREPERTAL